MDLVIDIDGVLCDTIREIQVRLEAEFHIDIPQENLDRFNLTETLKVNSIPSTWLMKCFKDPWFWAGGETYPENVETVNRWVDQGHNIHLVTGRGTDVAIPTAAWVKRKNIRFHKLKFVPSMKKYEYMLANNCVAIFEDSFFEANKVASYGMRSFVITRPWNIEFMNRITNPLVTYVDNLAGGDDFLERYEEFVL